MHSHTPHTAHRQSKKRRISIPVKWTREEVNWIWKENSAKSEHKRDHRAGILKKHCATFKDVPKHEICQLLDNMRSHKHQQIFSDSYEAIDTVISEEISSASLADPSPPPHLQILCAFLFTSLPNSLCLSPRFTSKFCSLYYWNVSGLWSWSSGYWILLCSTWWLRSKLREDA